MGIFPAFSRRCWAWKERLLGDGHDFFIPRPKTTRRLCGWLVSTASKEVPLEEVRLWDPQRCVDTMGKPRENHWKTMGKMKIW
jgi:hypothetical protein